MNDSSHHSPSPPPQPTTERTVFQLTLSFLLLALAVIGVTAGYWFVQLQPRLEMAADAHAKLIAQAQATLLAEVLQPRGDTLSVDEVSAAMGKILLVTNPTTGQPFIIGLALELDYTVVLAPFGSLELVQGTIPCTACFTVAMPLYAPLTDELLGLARFYVNAQFFKTLEGDIRSTLLIEMLFILALLIMAWWWVLRLGRQLHREVLERWRAEQAAQEANRAKSQFLANMSHEIRTPINAIQGLLYLVRQHALSVKVDDKLKKMEQAAQTLLSLINDILDFSKIEAGHIDLENVPFDLYTVLDRTRSMVGFRAVEKGLTLKFHEDEQVPKYLRGDPNRLGQVLLNLVGNAVKFTERGEVEVTVRPVAHSTDHLGSDDHIRLEFAVHDTGIGMTPEQQLHLFHIFSQADSSITRRFGGTGLGLVISQRLVEMMGGHIEVTSTAHQGSTFRFTVTLGRAEPADVEVIHTKPLPDAEHALRGARVLLVEDQPINQEVACEILRQVGVQVQVVRNGQEALHWLRDEPHGVDAVLMDLQMPIMDGYAATERLRADRQFTQLPIIAMTANVLSGERERCLAVGMNDYLPKPIDVPMLYRVLKRWVRLPTELPERPSEPPQTATLATEQVPSATDEERSITLRGVDVAAGLKRVGGNAALYRRLLAQLPEQHGDTMTRIRNAWAVGDKKSAAQQAHALAGVAGNLAATDLEQALRRLERAILDATGDVTGCLDEADMLLRQWLEDINTLNLQRDAEVDNATMPEEIPTQSSTPQERAAWHAQVEILARALAARDLKARAQFAELVRQTTDPTLQHPLHAVGQQIDKLRFAEALAMLETLRGESAD